MRDPFDALYLPIDPVAPDESFATGLRDRLRHKVFGTTQGAEMTSTPSGSALAPYLAVRDAQAAIRWYGEVFGATVVGEPIAWQGRIGHAELTVFGSRLMLADESPEYRMVAPPPDGPNQVSLHLSVSTVDELVATAEAAGATVERAPEDAPYGRSARIIDPFGHRWMFVAEH